MSGSEGTKEDLVGDLEIRARWRAQRAQRYPGDERDTRSADALRAAARDVAAMSGDDPRLVRLAEFYAVASDEAVAGYLEEQNRIMSRHGYDSDHATTDGLLEAFLEAAERAAREGR